MTQEQTEYVTVEQASARTRISSSTIRRAIASGALRYRAQQGKTKLLRCAEVDAWAHERSAIRVLDDDDDDDRK